MRPRAAPRAAGRSAWPRRLSFHRSGWVVSGGAVVLGLAAIATGNNLLFLLLGAMLGFIVLSGMLSEAALRGVSVRRRPPYGVVAGEPARLVYELANGKPRLPSFALEVGEAGAEARAFVGSVPPRGVAQARLEQRWPRRGVYRLEAVTLSTSFPFGLFQKERDVEAPGEVVVWPRSDRPVAEPRLAGERHRRREAVAPTPGMAAARGEYRALRAYRPGDDPRDVHWRSSARRGEPVVREYEREQAPTLWLCLDVRLPPGGADAATERAEAAVEVLAALAARAALRGDAFALATPAARVERGSGAPQLERVLDALARARFHPDAPLPVPPVPPAECVLVSAVGGAAGWGAVLVAAP